MTAPTESILVVEDVTDAYTVPLTPVPATHGLNTTMHTVAGGDISAGMIYPSTEREIVTIRKTSASTTTITVDCPNACSQGYTTVHDWVATMAAGDGTPTYKEFGPLSNYRYATTYGTSTDAVTNHIKITVSGTTTGLEIAVRKVRVSPSE